MTDIDNKTEFANWRQYHIGVYGRTPSEAEECHDFPIWLAARASTPPPAAEPCAHRIADVRNKVVKSGYMCIDCGAVFAAADHDEPRASAAPAVQAVGEPDQSRDIKQLASLLLVNPENGLPLFFAGPLESWGMGLSQAKLMDVDGNVWTMVAGLREGYKTEAQRNANLLRAVDEELRCAEQAAPAIQPPPSAEPAPADPRPVVGIVDERYLRPTNGGEG